MESNNIKYTHTVVHPPPPSVSRTFLSSQVETIFIKCQLPVLHPSNQYFMTCLWIWQSWAWCTNGITQQLSSADWLISLIMSSRSIQVIDCKNAPLFQGWVIFHCRKRPHLHLPSHPSGNTLVVCSSRVLWIVPPCRWVWKHPSTSRSRYFLKQGAKFFFLFAASSFCMVSRECVQSQNSLPRGQGSTLVGFSNKTVLGGGEGRETNT